MTDHHDCPRQIKTSPKISQSIIFLPNLLIKYFCFSFVQNTTEVKVIFASKANSDANNNRLSKHDKTKILDGKYNLISLAMEPPPLPSTTTIQPSVTTMPTKESVAPTTPMAPPKYASVMSPDGSFKLEWTYSNSKLMFKMTCKTTGWCAVGFTTTPDGRGMKNYDIAVAGFASNAGYIGVGIKEAWMNERID